jgi:toxin FitB
LIILDTNVVSEPFRPNPFAAVLEWLNRQSPATLCLTATSLAEIHRGIAFLPEGKRKRLLKEETDDFLESLFEGRIFAFDKAAAVELAELTAIASRNGKVIGFADGQIAAIASVHKYAVATRDTGPFVAAGLKVINPWLKDI